MRSRHSRSLAVLALIAATVCSEPSAPTPSAPVRSDPLAPAPTPTPNTPAVSKRIVFDSTARELATGDSLVLISWVAASASGTVFPDSVQWHSSDSTIVAVSPVTATASRLVGTRVGTATVDATSGELTARLLVKVLPLTAQPSTIVVDDFHMVEFQTPDLPGVWSYSPQLTLRDTSADGGSALIATTMELTAGLLVAPCKMVRNLGSAPVQIFREVSGTYELMLGAGGVAGGRVAPTARPVAHLTVRRGDGTATRLTVDGPIVPGALPSGNTPWSLVGALACG